MQREELGLAAGPARVVLQGAIDLVFEEDDGWVLVDYKSDAVTPQNRDGLVAFYTPQIDIYRPLLGAPDRAAHARRDILRPDRRHGMGSGFLHRSFTRASERLRTMSSPAYDLVVIGSGPAGQKGAIAAAKLGKRVAVIDRKEMVGGVCLHTGTIPSKTLREAILYLTGFSERRLLRPRLHARGARSPSRISPSACRRCMASEMEVVRAQLARNRVATLHGSARFVDPHTLELDERRTGAPRR